MKWFIATILMLIALPAFGNPGTGAWFKDVALTSPCTSVAGTTGVCYHEYSSAEDTTLLFIGGSLFEICNLDNLLGVTDISNSINVWAADHGQISTTN